MLHKLLSRLGSGWMEITVVCAIAPKNHENVDFWVLFLIWEVIIMSEKYLLTIDEAAEYFNIGKNKLRDMIKEPCCNFVLFNGKKALIKKNRLESYLDETVYLWLQETEVCDKISAIKNNIYAPWC